MSIIDTLNKLIPDEIIDGSSVKKTAEMVGQDGLDLAWKLYLVEYPVQLDDMELHFDIPNVSEGKKRSDGKYEIRFQGELTTVKMEKYSKMGYRFLADGSFVATKDGVRIVFT